MKKRHLLLSVVMILSSTMIVSAWDWMTPFKRPSKDIRTLIMVGNYTKQRILAELIQQETSQPILLLPAMPGGKIFFMPAKKEALEIENAKFTDFVKFTKPERILIIGDGGAVTQSYIDRIDPYQTKILVYNKNMEQAAIEIGKILDLTDLADDFAKLNKDLESGKLYKPGSAVSKPEVALPESSISNQSPVLPPLPKKEAKLIDENEVVPK
ncbi:MAG TPA: hypothetical protein P5270_01565 [Victivallales bacterium]|nr:hypothetical protein [Victivallales bacterium]HPO90911.1 hypothetical protein [Victivallales bacterium]HRR28026.1 hypothetical protein [Victivallales bacterium]